MPRDAPVTPVLRTLHGAMHVLFMLLLGVGAARGAQSSEHPTVLLVGCTTLLAWYCAAAFWPRPPGQLWFLVLLAGWAGLLTLSPELSWLAFALFLLALHVLPRTAALLVVLVGTVVVICVQVRRPEAATVPSIIGPTMGALVAVGIWSVYSALRQENDERRALNEELLAAQDDLVATHEELAGAQREAGALTERARLARDIHDTLAQGFSSIVLLSRAAAKEQDAARLREVLALIEQAAAAGLADARTVVHALTPSDLDEAPLTAALHRLAERQGDAVRVRVRVEGPQAALPTAVEAGLLRAAQGALANVRQHADADRATVTLRHTADEVTLEVRDEGVGFDPHAPVTGSATGGYGLRMIRERAAALGGTAQVLSRPGAGTVVRITVPLTPRGEP